MDGYILIFLVIYVGIINYFINNANHKLKAYLLYHLLGYLIVAIYSVISTQNTSGGLDIRWYHVSVFYSFPLIISLAVSGISILTQRKRNI